MHDRILLGHINKVLMAYKNGIGVLITEKTFSVEGAYEMDPLTTVKARLNNSGKLGAILQHGVKPNLIVTLSGKFETKGLDRTPKFGLSLALKPFD
ncbi:Mitochondrial outer membrane protein porin 5 [Platanthera guangdongensis]|uniref:Mitochondrial outer membrane protein porin 5 n=1 Tax=Platanthera guangdongensis TaxID=2320717 RepID=A0ABR2LJB0_9ASPA